MAGLFRVAVTGGLSYERRPVIHAVLDTIDYFHSITTLIYGEGRWARLYADSWAKKHLVPLETYMIAGGASTCSERIERAEAAHRMLYDGRPDLLVVFPGVGTSACVAQANLLRIGILEIRR